MKPRRRNPKDSAGDRARGRSGGRDEPATAGSPRRPRASRGRGSLTVAIAAVVAAAALAIWSQRAWILPGPRPASIPTSPESPVPGMTLQQESNEATRLVNVDHPFDSLPYYRHLLAALPDNWHVRFNYATAVSNAALESRGRPGNAGPRSRSSVERVAMLREALVQIDMLERRLTAPRDLAQVRELRGRLYKNWGFPIDALVELRAAQGLDPQWRQVRVNADFFVLLLHHPETNIDSLR